MSYRKKSRRSDPYGSGSGGSRRRSKSADPLPVTKNEEKDKKEDGESNNEKLLVALRIRPLKNEEMARGYESVATKVDSKMVLLASTKSKKVDHLRERRNNERQYMFDVVFGPDSRQEDVYEATTKHLVNQVMSGYNATVFAYGATGGGKTYTMVGTQDNPGIMVRALNDLFAAAGEKNRKVIFPVIVAKSFGIGNCKIGLMAAEHNIKLW